MLNILVYTTKLKNLIINESNCVDDKVLIYVLNRYPDIQILEVRNCPSVDGTFLQYLKHKPQLHLWIDRCQNIDPQVLLKITKIHLKGLDMENLHSLTNNTLQAIGKNFKGSQISIKNCQNISDTGLIEFFKNHNTLKSIDISENPQLTTAVVAPLQNMKKLELFYFQGCSKIDSNAINLLQFSD